MTGSAWPFMPARLFHLGQIPGGFAHVSRHVVEMFWRADQLVELACQGVEVLLDDRPERPGIKFADMDLIGIPHRVVIGDKGLDKGQVEYKDRRKADSEDIAVDNLEDFLKKLFS